MTPATIAIPPPRRHTATTPPHTVPLPLERTSNHLPYVDKGESEIALRLRRLGVTYEYESRFYALRYEIVRLQVVREGGFVPDFHLPATNTRPAINLEVTFADRGLPSMPRSQRLANLERVELKRQKIELTRHLYGIQTVLITSGVFLAIRRNPKHLERLIRRAVLRHERDLRNRAAA